VDFTEKHGPVVWIRYALDDIEGIEADDWIEDDEMDSDYTMSEDDDVIRDHQSALVAHLSSEAV
jgi:hypothetical protein